MIARLMRGYDWAVQFAEAGTAFIAVALLTLWYRLRPAPYPFRCLHCARPIRVADRRVFAGPLYRDRRGDYVCDGTLRMWHRPMPTIR